MGRQRRRHARPLEPAEESPRPDPLEQLHRRNVERTRQRLANRHRATELVVEIGWPIAPELHRPVLDQRFGMRDPRVEREAVYDRLQRRTGRAHRLDHVDRPEPALVEISGRPDVREHLANYVIHDQHRRRKLRPQCRHVPPRGQLELALQRTMDRQPVNGRPLVPTGNRFGEVGRIHSERPPSRRHRLAVGPQHFRRADEPRRLRLRQDPRPRRSRAGSVPRNIRPPPLGRLRQRHQQRRLAEREPPRLPPEIGERGRPHALEVTAERRKPEIEIENLVLAEMPLELHGPQHLPPLGQERPPVPFVQEAGHLHRQRRGPRDDPAIDQELPARPRERPPVDAAVITEPLVLERDQQVEIPLVDHVVADRQAPSPVLRRERAQQVAIAVEHDRRRFPGPFQRQRPQPADLVLDDQIPRRAGKHRRRDARRAKPQRVAQPAATPWPRPRPHPAAPPLPHVTRP